MSEAYTYIWEYTVDPSHESAFLAAYSSEGEWVQLFRQHDGYVKTELHRDRDSPNRFVTIDYWKSRQAWETFREVADAAFRDLDERCESYTTQEQEIGTFTKESP